MLGTSERNLPTAIRVRETGWERSRSSEPSSTSPATVEVDSDGQLRVRLTNRAGGPVTDLRVTLTATDPLTSDDPTAYVPRRADGDAETVTFHLDVSDEAVPGQHPVALTFAYDDVDGTARRVADVPVAVTVVEESGPGFPVEAVVVVGLAAVLAGVWWYRRR